MQNVSGSSLPVRYLQTKHHEEKSDMQIKFADEGHAYWVYSPFLKEWITNKNGYGTAPLISATTILNTYFPSPDYRRMAINIWNNQENRIKMETDPTYMYFGCKSVDDVMDKWGDGRLQGCRMHNTFEDMGNLLEFARDNPSHQDVLALYQAHDSLQGYREIRYFFEAMKLLGVDGVKRRFYRTEFLMANPALSISGMADGFLYDIENDYYVIIDYKRVKGGIKGDPMNGKPVETLAPSGRGQILPSFERLRKHSVNIYGCQLTLYKHLFEGMFPGRKVGAMYLIVVDSTKINKPGALKIHEVPLNKYDENITEVFQRRAWDILSDYSDTIPPTLTKELMKYLPKNTEVDVATEELPSIFSDGESTCDGGSVSGDCPPPKRTKLDNETTLPEN